MKQGKRIGLCIALALLLTPLVLSFDLDNKGDPKDQNLFQFVRIHYNGYILGGWGGRRWVPPWAHDYPRAERNFLKILSELTTIETTPESYVILEFDDPKIMNYPMLYVSEPGYWDITDKEAENIREYLDRGGFILFDDFGGVYDWNNLTGAMKKVLPERSFQKLTLDDPIFHCFYDIATLDVDPPYQLAGRGKPQFWGIYDESGRLQVMADLNNDIGDFWEWSDEDIYPVNLSNEAFKFGVNFVIYAYTH